MVLAEYAKRIVLFEAEGYRPPKMAKMLESEGIFFSRRGVAKFLLRVKAAGSNTIKEAAYNYSATCVSVYIIESVDSISKDERGFPLTQYITNARISRGGYTFTHFKHHHLVLRLISYRMGA